VIGALGVDLWRTIWSRTGFLCGFLCLVPVGTGSASGVLAQAEVAAHWHAGAAQVELVQGFLSGIVSIFGCIIGGYGCNRWGARRAYVIYGFVMAVIALGMAFLPAMVWVYVVGGLAYAFGTGLAYAAFTGFVLDAIGAGNAATKYNAFASVSNTPIWYMGLVLAAVHTHFGPRNMLVAEALFEAGGALLFVIVAALTTRWRRAAIVAQMA
jgi:MFS family permease